MITKFNFKDKTIKSYAIRKLTPLECFRLMGVRDATIHIMQSTYQQAKARIEQWIGKGIKAPLPSTGAAGGGSLISASQQYKQAGNSIVVDVLAAIYQTLIYPQPPKPKAQLSMFDTLFPEDALPAMPPKPYRDGDEFTVLTTFSGYDSQLMACDALREHHPNFRWTCAGWSDIDRYACQMHDLIFPQFADRALGDITKIDWFWMKYALLHNLTYEQVISEEWRENNVYNLSAEEYNALRDEVEAADSEIDLFTYSSPCQDISQAGKQMGLQEGTGTRSALLWNVADAVEILRPKYLLQENVAALVSEKFLPDFQRWIKRLEDLGYVTKWALLNAKDIGMEGTGPVPQNRLRVFAISMRKDCAFDYQFPEPMPLEKRLEDILEPEVDEKYFLKDDAVSKFLKANDRSATEGDACQSKKDTALFHQFALPPTHEAAMFLKTHLQLFMEGNNAWEMSATELDDLISDVELEDCITRSWVAYKNGLSTFSDDKFKARFEENMKR